MTDPAMAFRYAVGNALSGILTYDSELVPIADSLTNIDPSVDIYVLLTNQTSVERSNFTKFVHEVTLTIDIVHKTHFAVTKDVVDTIAQTIQTILRPSASTNGLINYMGVQFTDLYLDSDNYLTVNLSGGPIMRRLLVFGATAHQ